MVAAEVPAKLNKGAADVGAVEGFCDAADDAAAPKSGLVTSGLAGIVAAAAEEEEEA